MAELNQEQKQAIEYLNGPLIIVAGAGTGKTLVITEKISHIIKQGIAKAENILALTFTEKAALEMQERVDTLLNNNYSGVSISTFHAFCQKILEDYALDIGLSNQFKVLTENEAWLLVRENFSKFKLDYYKPLANPTRHIHELLKHFSKCKDELVSPTDYFSFVEEKKADTDELNIEEKNRLKEICEAYNTYNNLLIEKNCLDFSDLIFYTIKLLEKRPNILEKIRSKFRYILVDEFQDVNWSQYLLVKLLNSKSNQLTVVGDDDQSIYAFRGASVSNILRFNDDYPEAHKIVLTKNYRSDQKILDTAYKLIQNNNPDRLEVKLNIDKRLISSIPSDGESEIASEQSSDLEEEVEKVVSKIVSLKNKDSNSLWREHAILVRANSHAVPFINFLEKNSIPYIFQNSSGLLRQNIVLDCLSFFKLLIDKSDSAALYRLLCVGVLDINSNDLQKITYNAKRKSLSYFEILNNARIYGFSADSLTKIEKIAELINEGSEGVKTQKPSQILYHFLEKSGYLAFLQKEESKPDQVQNIHYLSQFFEKISKFEEVSTHKLNLRGFLENLEYSIEAGDEGDVEPLNSTADGVNIMTVHASKGLEFKYVYLVNLVEDRFPTRKQKDGIEIPEELVKEKAPKGDAHYQEERRLFYVAITRAKKSLYLYSSSNYGGVREKKISRFLDEIGYKFSETLETKKNIENLKKTPFLTSSKNSLNETSKPKKFSFSQISSYETCPYQYKLAHVIKIPTKGNASLSFGQTMHSTMQKFYIRVQELNKIKQVSLFSMRDEKEATPSSGFKSPQFEELLDMYNQSWIDDWYQNSEQKKKYYEQGKDILKKFYERNNNNFGIPINLEAWFKVSIDGNILHGRIDRIDQLPDGTLEIIDYKTGRPKEKLEAGDKEQLLLYQIATEELKQFSNFGKTSKLTFYYLNNDTKISFLGTEKEIEKFKNKTSQIIQKIYEHEFKATPSPYVCGSCSFKEICEFRQL